MSIKSFDNECLRQYSNCIFVQVLLRHIKILRYWASRTKIRERINRILLDLIKISWPVRMEWSKSFINLQMKMVLCRISRCSTKSDLISLLDVLSDCYINRIQMLVRNLVPISCFDNYTVSFILCSTVPYFDSYYFSVSKTTNRCLVRHNNINTHMSSHSNVPEKIIARPERRTQQFQRDKVSLVRYRCWLK